FGRQIVAARIATHDEHGMSAANTGVRCIVERRIRHPASVQLDHALASFPTQTFNLPEFYRLGRTRLGTGGNQSHFLPVIGETAPVEAIFADAVPFLAGNFARLAANAQRRIGEKRCHAHADSILCANSLSTSFPRGRRPGRMSHTKAFVSIMRTLGSSLIASRSLTTSPFTRPL